MRHDLHFKTCSCAASTKKKQVVAGSLPSSQPSALGASSYSGRRRRSREVMVKQRGRGRGRGGRGGGGRQGRGSSQQQHGGGGGDRRKGGGSPHPKRRKHQQEQPQEQQQQQQQQQQKQAQRANTKPPPFVGFRGESDRFVEESDPQFQEVVLKCYAGFCVQGPETFDDEVSRG